MIYNQKYIPFAGARRDISGVFCNVGGVTTASPCTSIHTVCVSFPKKTSKFLDERNQVESRSSVFMCNMVKCCRRRWRHLAGCSVALADTSLHHNDTLQTANSHRVSDVCDMSIWLQQLLRWKQKHSRLSLRSYKLANRSYSADTSQPEPTVALSHLKSVYELKVSLNQRITTPTLTHRCNIYYYVRCRRLVSKEPPRISA